MSFTSVYKRCCMKACRLSNVSYKCQNTTILMECDRIICVQQFKCCKRIKSPQPHTKKNTQNLRKYSNEIQFGNSHKMLQEVNKFIEYWWFRYLMVTELYIVEKWERITMRKYESHKVCRCEKDFLFSVHLQIDF